MVQWNFLAFGGIMEYFLNSVKMKNCDLRMSLLEPNIVTEEWSNGAKNILNYCGQEMSRNFVQTFGKFHRYNNTIVKISKENLKNAHNRTTDGVHTAETDLFTSTCNSSKVFIVSRKVRPHERPFRRIMIWVVGLSFWAAFWFVPGVFGY